MVRPTGTLDWLLDADAAGELTLPGAQWVQP